MTISRPTRNFDIAEELVSKLEKSQIKLLRLKHREGKKMRGKNSLNFETTSRSLTNK